MSGAPLPFVVGAVGAALGVVWLVLANARAFARHRVSLAPGRASRLSLGAWLLSLLSAWTGPLVLPLSALALLLGLVERRRVLRGEATARSELPATMAVKNAIVLLAVVAALMVGLWLSSSE